MAVKYGGMIWGFLERNPSLRIVLMQAMIFVKKSMKWWYFREVGFLAH
jgi:hypothetical protein